MTVAELITKLHTLPPDLPVAHSRDDFPFDIRCVEVIKATRFAPDHWWESFYPHEEDEPVVDIAVIRG